MKTTTTITPAKQRQLDAIEKMKSWNVQQQLDDMTFHNDLRGTIEFYEDRSEPYNQVIETLSHYTFCTNCQWLLGAPIEVSIFGTIHTLVNDNSHEGLATYASTYDGVEVYVSYIGNKY